MVSTQRVMQASMNGPGIDQIGQGHLFDAAQTLEGRVGQYLKNQILFDGYEPMHWVVDDFSHRGGGFSSEI